jgi:hypothetical protein
MKAKAALPYTKCPENKWDLNVVTQNDKPDWFDKESGA